MTKHTSAPLRTLIAQYLDSVEDATAAQIAKAVGQKDYPSRVIHELNAMRADGLIEAERKGKSKDLSYWLAVPVAQIINPTAKPLVEILQQAEAPAPPPKIIKPGTRKAQIWDALQDGAQLKAREIEAALKLPQGALDPTLNALIKSGTLDRTKWADGVYRYHRPYNCEQQPQPAVGQNTGSNGSGSPSEHHLLPEAVAVQPQPATEALASLSPELAPVAADVTDENDAMPEPDPVWLAAANRMLSEQSDALSREIEEAAETLATFVDGDIDTTDMELPELASAAARMLGELEHEIDMLRAKAFKLQQKLDDTQDVDDLVAGYVVKAPKRRLRVITRAESAVAAALAAAKSTGRADVMALVPVGRAVRGAEWRDA